MISPGPTVNKPSPLKRVGLLLIVFVFVISGQSLSQITYDDFEIIPDDAAAGDQFGMSVDIDDGIIAAGAPFHQDNGWRSGTAYLFDAATGTQLFKLLPDDGESRHGFGHAIAVGDGIVAVGPYRDDDLGNNTGSVYIFDAETGQQISEIYAGDPSHQEEFGSAVAIDDGILAVGAHKDWYNDGAAYLFDVATLQQLHKLVPSTVFLGDDFGGSIDISDGKVAVGAKDSEDNGTASGSVFLFDASTGEQITKFLPGDGAWADHFGLDVALQNGVLVGGADGADNVGQGSGAVYAVSYEAGGTSDVPDASDNPANLVLHPNYPNPFNPSTTISYNIKKDCHVKLEIYSMRGQRVRTLVDGWQTSGVRQTVVWNGQDASGKSCPVAFIMRDCATAQKRS
ncbi:MAG: hypothetical protein GY780_10285 [bacterium]|nr:hypothetical protein [bacterium]